MAKRNRGGRPPTIIDQTVFEGLCKIQCTLVEIAAYFDCDDGTVETWCKKTYKKGFSDVFRTKRGKGHISLRRKQWEMALNGNVTMLLWLGKQYLGQKDKFESEVTVQGISIKIDGQDQNL